MINPSLGKIQLGAKLDIVYFQLLGGVDTGPVEAVLLAKDGESLAFEMGEEPVEITLNGPCLLELSLLGYVPIEIPVTIDANASPPTIRSIGGEMPLAVSLSRVRMLEASSFEQSAWLFVLRVECGHPREHIFVSGLDYIEEALDFEALSDARRQSLVDSPEDSSSIPADKSTFVTQFDFSANRRRSFMLCSPQRWMVVNEANYSSGGSGGSGGSGDSETYEQSITDVYDWIIDAGRSAPGRIIELCVFSHEKNGTPSLTGADDENKAIAMRNPEDRDPRTKDLSKRNLDVESFAKAFSTDAYCHLFGSIANPLYQSCADVISTSRPADPNARFTIQDETGNSTEVTWDDSLAVFRLALQRSYHQKLALITGLPVWASAPGMAAETFTGTPAISMRINASTGQKRAKAIADTFDMECDEHGYLKYVSSSQSKEQAKSAKQASASPTPTTAPQQGETCLVTLTPLDDRIQFVNLEPNSEAPDNGRVVTVKVQLDPPQAGVPIYWSFKEQSEFEEDLPSENKAGFGAAGVETTTTNTNVDGVAQVEFHHSTHGGDAFVVSAGRSEGSCETSTGKLTVWRKLWYEVDTMKRPQGGVFDLDNHPEISDCYADVFVVFEHHGVDNHPAHVKSLEWDPAIELAAKYFGAAKTPVQLHLTSVDLLANKRVEEKTYEVDDDITELYESNIHAFGDDKDWLLSAKYRDGETLKALDSSRVKLLGSSDEMTRPLEVDLGGLGVAPAPGNMVDVVLELVFADHANGISDGTEGPHACVAIGYQEMQYDPQFVGPMSLGTMVHEFGHKLGMVPQGENQWVPGSHCLEAQCVMFARNDIDRGRSFCDECKKTLRRIDLGAYNSAYSSAKGTDA